MKTEQPLRAIIWCWLMEIDSIKDPEKNPEYVERTREKLMAEMQDVLETLENER